MTAPSRRPHRLSWIVASLLVLLASLRAGAVRADEGQEGDDLRVFVLTMSPGDHPFFKFGHNALLIEGPTRGIVYNFGTFSFDSPALIPKFLKGRLKYWLSRSGALETFQSYAEANRWIAAQELDLTAAQKRALAQGLDDNARPQNREYLYDYFWDNCSTRVRDWVDRVTGGRVRAAAQGPAAQTFRGHALRMTADLLPEYLGLHFGLGSLTDEPLDLWRESFLPERFQALLRTVRIPAAGGGDKPLVKAEKMIYQANRPPKPPAPPAWGVWFAAAGLALGGALVGLGWLARRRPGARVALGASLALLGLVLGLLGLVLVALWALTNHRAAHANENILQCAPIVLGLVWYGVGVARGRGRAIDRAFVVAAAALAAAILGLLLKALPAFRQDNLAFAAFFVPLWAGTAAGLRLLRQRSAATSAGESARL